MKKRTLRMALLLCLLATLLVLTTACGRKAPAYADLDFSSVDPATCQETDEITNYVKLSVSITPAGSEEKEYLADIIIRLYPEVAPETVANFQSLVADKFYDGLTFHRVRTGFMIQGGDPAGDGTGEGPNSIKGEFYTNGFENNLKHIRGVISMARLANDPNSASSQFFIMHKTTPSLNDRYATFGYVVAGMESVDAIAAVPVKNTEAGEASVPTGTVTIESMRFVQP